MTVWTESSRHPRIPLFHRVNQMLTLEQTLDLIVKITPTDPSPPRQYTDIGSNRSLYTSHQHPYPIFRILTVPFNFWTPHLFLLTPKIMTADSGQKWKLVSCATCFQLLPAVFQHLVNLKLLEDHWKGAGNLWMSAG
jgi:hypothetical protein